MKPTESIAALPFLEDLSTVDACALLSQQQTRAVNAVEQASDAIAGAVDAAFQRIETTGRLIWVGAGASIRMAVQESSELWPTFGWPLDRSISVIAGGPLALTRSIEGAEDAEDEAVIAIQALNPTANDVVIGVAASGGSPFTCAALETRGAALGIGVSNNPDTRLLAAADCPIYLPTGPEIIAGSTRMIAGSAQKIALNTFTTALMVKLNRTYKNLMVDMAANNQKLQQRKLVMLRAIHPQVADAVLLEALERANGQVKLAAVIALGVPAAVAADRLERHHGALAPALSVTDGN